MVCCEWLRNCSRSLTSRWLITSIVPLYLLCEFASKNTKIVLNGDGGDEIFAGYQSFQAHKLVTSYDVLRRFTKVVLRAMVSRLPVSHGYLSTDFKTQAVSQRSLGLIRSKRWHNACARGPSLRFLPKDHYPASADLSKM